jgi:hypothetical protein
MPEPKSSDPFTQPRFRPIVNVVFAVAIVLSLLVVIDNATCELTTGKTIRGMDYLVLGIGGAYLLYALLAREAARRLAVSLVGVALLLVLIEVGFSLWALTSPRPFAWYVWPPNYASIQLPTDLPGVSSKGVFTTNSLGIRGPEFSDADRYRILCVGGSTTECIYLDNAKAWPRLVGEALAANTAGVWVGNIGRSGTTTPHHVTLFEHLPEADLVDCWVVLCGINDYGQHVRGTYEETTADSWKHTFKYRRPGLGSDLWRPLQRNSFVFCMFESLRKRIKVALQGENPAAFQDTRAKWVKKQQEKRRLGHKRAVELPLDDWMDEYERQLMRMIELSRAKAKRLIFVTQPTIWKADLPAELADHTIGPRLPDGSYLDDATRAEGMDRYNQRMRDVCQREGIECVDLAASLPKSLEVFYDDCHFNEAGAKSVAEKLGPVLYEGLPSELRCAAAADH